MNLILIKFTKKNYSVFCCAHVVCARICINVWGFVCARIHIHVCNVCRGKKLKFDIFLNYSTLLPEITAAASLAEPETHPFLTFTGTLKHVAHIQAQVCK